MVDAIVARTTRFNITRSTRSDKRISISRPMPTVAALVGLFQDVVPFLQHMIFRYMSVQCE